MKAFILGACVGLTLAGAVGAGAQLAPFDAPLADQIQAERADWYLRTLREIEAMERENRRLADERLAPPVFPTPRKSAIDTWLEERTAAQNRAMDAESERETRRLDRLERQLDHQELLDALDDLKRRR